MFGHLKSTAIFVATAMFLLGCGGGSSTTASEETTLQIISGTETEEENSTEEAVAALPAPEVIDSKVEVFFGRDDTSSRLPAPQSQLCGNWYGEQHYMRIYLQLRKDGTYRYHSRLAIGKYHNTYRYSDYNGTWQLAHGNAQIVLSLPGVEAPLVLGNRFPQLYSPADVNLSPGTMVDSSAVMEIDMTQDSVEAVYTATAKAFMQSAVRDFGVDYFTMVAPKANSEAFWSSVHVKPMGYNYGHKLGDWTAEWQYALQRIKEDPKNYTMVISDENWQTLIGSRKSYIADIQKPEKVYKWFEYFKDQMQILGKVPGTVLYIIAGDAPAYWASDVRRNHDNDPRTIAGKIIESRFPEVLERNPSNSWAGIFQMMDYLRMKYAPNVKLGYTIKTWGIAEKDIYHEPESGWDRADTVRVMAEYLNNYEVQFDLLSFNFNPGSSHTNEAYASAARYFGAISKQLESRDGSEPKIWIWKLSLWDKEQPRFDFTHIDFLVNECNAIGMTLGHGNDLAGKSGFSDDPDNGIYVRSWIEEYYTAEENSEIPIHATSGPVEWR